MIDGDVRSLSIGKHYTSTGVHRLNTATTNISLNIRQRFKLLPSNNILKRYYYYTSLFCLQCLWSESKGAYPESGIVALQASGHSSWFRAQSLSLFVFEKNNNAMGLTGA
jgi:hypothetical protein